MSAADVASTAALPVEPAVAGGSRPRVARARRPRPSYVTVTVPSAEDALLARKASPEVAARRARFRVVVLAVVLGAALIGLIGSVQALVSAVLTEPEGHGHVLRRLAVHHARALEGTSFGKRVEHPPPPRRFARRGR